MYNEQNSLKSNKPRRFGIKLKSINNHKQLDFPEDIMYTNDIEN